MTSIDLSTTFADQELNNCIYNASGAKCRTREELNDLLSSSAGAILTKSATLEKREGNPEPRYRDLNLGSINSMGLPNLGLDFYLDFIENAQTEKALFVSVAGLTMEENLEMLKKLNQSSKNFAVELNLSCPNIPGKPQTGYDFDRTKEVLERAFKFYQKPLGVKLPPYFDMVHFRQMAEILNQFPLRFVTCINSIGNALFVDAEKEEVTIKPKDGFGGIGGEYVKPTALANVRMFYTLLKKEIAIVGCGGVVNGKDVFEHILCGASAVQIGTQLMKDGTNVFQRLQLELKEIMKRKGYKNIEQFKGKLKSI